MRLNSGFVIMTAILVSGIQTQPVEHNRGFLRPRDQTCQDIKQFYYGNLERCLKEGLVGYKDFNDCFNLNSQGPCEDGEILVFAEGPCLLTECAANRDKEGTPCREDWFNYEGTCLEAGSQGCHGRFGRRVRPDLHGNAQCVCDRELGFVELGGECYFEFLKGPCQSGEQLIMDISGSLDPKCVKNTCSEGYMLTRPVERSQTVCYNNGTLFGKLYEQHLTIEESEKVNPCEGFLCGSGAVLEGECFDVLTENGDCLEEAVEPGWMPKELLLHNMCKAFNKCSSFTGESEPGRSARAHQAHSG